MNFKKNLRNLFIEHLQAASVVLELRGARIELLKKKIKDTDLRYSHMVTITPKKIQEDAKSMNTKVFKGYV